MVLEMLQVQVEQVILLLKIMVQQMILKTMYLFKEQIVLPLVIQPYLYQVQQIEQMNTQIHFSL